VSGSRQLKLGQLHLLSRFTLRRAALSCCASLSIAFNAWMIASGRLGASPVRTPVCAVHLNAAAAEPRCTECLCIPQ